MIEIAVLAATVVGKFLIPYLTKGGKDLTDDLTQAGADAAAGTLVKTAESLWDRIKKKFDHGDDLKAVELFEQNPEAMDKMLSQLLEKCLAEDGDFRQQISDLVETPVAGTGQTAWQLMGTYVGAVDARGAVITGSVSGLTVNAPTSPSPAPPSPLPPPPPARRADP